MFSRSELRILVASGVIAASAACSPPPIRHAGFPVHGVILFEAERLASGGQEGEEAGAVARKGAMVLLPDVEVSLRDAGTHAVLATASTDLTGHFRLPEHKPSKYQLCWEGDGWLADCLPQDVEITTSALYVEPIRIVPDGGGGTHTIVGEARFQDRSLCRFLDIQRRVDITARVELSSGATVRANSAGEYVLPVVPNTGGSIRASCPDENEVQIKQKIDDWRAASPTGTTLFTGDLATVFGGALTASLVQAPASSQDQYLAVTLPARSPALASFLVTRAGQVVSRAAPGETVRITAAPLDPGPRVRLWRVSGGVITAHSDEAIDWTLPMQVGQLHLELITANGRGGWSRETKVLDVTQDTSLIFSGDIEAIGSPAPPPSLAVTVNGKPMAVGAGGHFFGRVAPHPDQRYVLNVEADGYVPISRIYHRESTGGFYQLHQALKLTFPAAQGGELVFDDERTDRRVSIQLQPGSLVAADGTPFSGTVEASLAYIDPSVTALPGDYDAVSRQGRDQALISYGALYVKLEDGAGNSLQLAAGSQAEIALPIPPDRDLSQAPQSIAVWFYDEASGFWKEEGTASLVGDAYRAEVQHFSTINMDVGTEGNAVCARVQVDFQKTPDNPILRVSLTLPGGGRQVKQTTLDQKLNAVFRLLPDQDVTFELLHSDGSAFDDFVLLDAASSAPIPNETISLNSSHLMQGIDLWPDEPFLDCVPFVIASGDIPDSAGFLSRKGANQVAEVGKSEAYYELLDPNDERLTLESWLTRNGFQPIAQAGGGFLFEPAAQVLEVAYLNHGDLGSGRKMHCRSDANRVACVVGNYATAPEDNFNRDPAGADVAGAANSGTGFATVAMEYSEVEGFAAAGRLVKFFTYGGGGGRVTLAQLDRVSGDRLQPQVCMMCHGGNLPAIYEVNGANESFPATAAAAATLDGAHKTAILEAIKAQRSSFREFDIDNLRNLQGSNPENKMRALNCNYVRQTNPNQEIQDIITAWYGANCTSAGSGVQSPYHPWGTAKQALYDSVAARSCRTCHIAQTGFEFDDVATFDSFNGGGNGPYTCTKAMPQAEVTYNAHWVNKRQDAMEAEYGPCP